MKNCILTVFFLLNTASVLQAQWEEKFVLFADNAKEGDFQKAKGPLFWLLKNYPEVNKTLYTKGKKVYEGMVNSTEDPLQKKVYQDSVLTLFDMRIQHFGEEAKVLNIKGYSAFRYWQNRPEKTEELYELYKKIIDLNGKATYNQNVSTYMYLLGLMKEKREELDDAKILEVHEKLTEIISFNIQKYQQEKKLIYIDAWEKTQTYIDSQLEKYIKINCEFIKTRFFPKYKINPADTTLGKKIYALSILKKCAKEEYFIESMLLLVKEAPGFSRYKALALAYKARGVHDKYIQYMNAAFEAGGTPSNKAGFYLELAQEASRKGQVNQARNYARKAMKIDAGKTVQATNFIGMLYYHSGTVCKTNDPEKAPVYNAVAYLAAYEMFEKTGNTTMMAKAQQYFPSAANIHTLGMTGQIGSQIRVGCWIGGTATLRKR